MKNPFRSTFLVAAGAVLSISAIAQDIHYSQFFASPLNLNPALTGFIQGNVRGILNYRNQWKSITPNSYVTVGGSVDMAFGRGKMGDDWVGGGLVILNDKAGSGALSKMKVMVAGSYFKGLTEGQYIAAGLSAGLVQRKLDPSGLIFENQIDLSTGTTTGSNGENTLVTSDSYIDANVGAIWAYSVKKITLYAGGSLLHLNAPKESFLGSDTTKIATQPVIHGSGQIALSEKVSILPSFIYMYDRKAHEMMLGASLGYNLLSGGKLGVFYAGLWYRFADALVPFVALEYETFRVGFSYDVNTSTLNEASNSQGGPELSFKFELPVPSKRASGKISCPRF